MVSVSNVPSVKIAETARKAGREKLLARLDRAGQYLNVFGLGWLIPIARMIAGDNVKVQMKELWQQFGIPVLAILFFLWGWSVLAPRVQTSLGAIPGPAQVWEQVTVLWADHRVQREKRDDFYARQDEKNRKFIEQGQADKVKDLTFTGAPTYIDQIMTSLVTVFAGFLLGSIIAIPLGVFCGLSKTVNAAFNPLIQIFKPVSPLAWLPIVTMVVSAVYASTDPTFSKSFIISALTVMLCSIWPTIINTALGVSSIDKDLMNVSRVLKLDWKTQVFKLILPSSLPLIFTGLRLSLGVGWMVLIAAEMLAQNPGLGKFVWDEFQNGSSESLAKIMVAVLTIGLIGFLLDRIMFALQAMFTYSATR